MSSQAHMTFRPVGLGTQHRGRVVSGVSARSRCWSNFGLAAKGRSGLEPVFSPASAAHPSIPHGKRTDAPGAARFVMPNPNGTIAPAGMPGSAQPARGGAYFQLD